MTMIVQIIARSAPSSAIDTVEKAFCEAGLETTLYKLGKDDGENDAIIAEMAAKAGTHPCQVWIVPGNFVELIRHHQDQAKSMKALLGMDPSEPTTRRLLITLDPDFGNEPDGHRVLSLTDLEEGHITPSELRSFFESPSGY